MKALITTLHISTDQDFLLEMSGSCK